MAIALIAPSTAFAADADHIAIDVTATIAERCGIARGPATLASAALPDLETAQTLGFDFQLDCNTPFAIAVSSSNGAMVLDDPTRAGPVGRTETGFSNRKAYSVALALETDDAPIATRPCDAADLVAAGSACPFYGTVAGQGLSSGRRTAIRRNGRVIVGWRGGDDGIRRAAGTYQDTLTIVVGPRT